MHSQFRLFLQTELANPHILPEVQTQCALVNFAITARGLEEQLMALAVNLEAPEVRPPPSDLIPARPPPSDPAPAVVEFVPAWWNWLPDSHDGIRSRHADLAADVMQWTWRGGVNLWHGLCQPRRN